MRRVAEPGVVAISRKLVITVNYNQVGWQTLISLAALIPARGWVYTQEKKCTTQYGGSSWGTIVFMQFQTNSAPYVGDRRQRLK